MRGFHSSRGIVIGSCQIGVKVDKEGSWEGVEEINGVRARERETRARPRRVKVVRVVGRVERKLDEEDLRGGVGTGSPGPSG